MLITIEAEGNGSFQVVITNPNAESAAGRPYRFVGESFSATENSDGYGLALKDAKHWESLYKLAKVPVDLAVVERA